MVTLDHKLVLLYDLLVFLSKQQKNNVFLIFQFLEKSKNKNTFRQQNFQIFSIWCFEKSGLWMGSIFSEMKSNRCGAANSNTKNKIFVSCLHTESCLANSFLSESNFFRYFCIEFFVSDLILSTGDDGLS